MTKTYPGYTDPNDILRDAYIEAQMKNCARYVVPSPEGYHILDRPSPKRTQWQVDPDGQVFAHIYDPDTNLTEILPV